MNETRILSLRQGLGWTQERLAAESGVGLRTIQRLEAGHDASLETLMLVSNALHISVRELFAVPEGEEMNGRIEAMALRTELQQGSRDRTTRAGLRAYVGAGAVVTLVSIAIGYWGALLMLGYWGGIGLLLWALRARVLEPQLDKRYPLSQRTRLIETQPMLERMTQRDSRRVRRDAGRTHS